MRLEGSHTLAASLQEVWNKLLDPAVLARTTPGVEKLEADGKNKYNASFLIKMGPVKGSFAGTLEVRDQLEPESFAVSMVVNGKQGYVAAEGKLALRAIADTQTEVQFSGDAKITGLLARTGQRVLQGVANTLTRQFFQALEQEFSPLPSLTESKTTLVDRIKSKLSKPPSDSTPSE